MAMDASVMLTLTTRANIVEYSGSWKQASAFWRAMRREFESPMYCGGPEQQKRGAWHWHFGMPERVPVGHVRDIWRHVCGDGNIDLQARDALQIARYTAKYIGKSLGCVGYGRSSYMRSRNIPKPEVQEVFCDEAAEALQVWGEAFPEWSGAVVPINEGAAFWAATWV